MRAKILAGFQRLAEKHLTAKRRSMVLSCSQFYADEAGDAVHDGISSGKGLVPASLSDAERMDYTERWKYLAWDSNSGAVYAFAPMCNEEGFSDFTAEDDDGSEDYEGSSSSSSSSSALAIAQRLDDGTVRVSWLGNLHRAWLDFPKGMADRDDDSGNDLEQQEQALGEARAPRRSPRPGRDPRQRAEAAARRNLGAAGRLAPFRSGR